MSYEPKLPPRDDFAERVAAKIRANRQWPSPRATTISDNGSSSSKNSASGEPPTTTPEVIRANDCPAANSR